ncbi:MAG: hypothetical protein IT378_01515 [Sandaracinaceae bacterium]|nr:hypothetical protein [Sandaracinaceae bacterium]
MERKRPGVLLAIAIIGIGLGVLGGCMGLYTVVATSFQDALARMQEQAAQMQPTSEQQEFQRELNHRIMEVQARYRIPILAHQGLNLFASIALLIACILLLRWRSNAPGVAMFVVAANTVIDLGGAVVQSLMQRENAVAVSEAMEHLTESANAPPGMERTMQGVMGASAAMGFCWVGALLLIKLGYYVWVALYVRKPDVKAMFTE